MNERKASGRLGETFHALFAVTSNTALGESASEGCPLLILLCRDMSRD